MVAVKVRQSPYLLLGRVALMRNGEVVWCGLLSAPWDDVDCDEIVVSGADYDEIKKRISGN